MLYTQGAAQARQTVSARSVPANQLIQVYSGVPITYRPHHTTIHICYFHSLNHPLITQICTAYTIHLLSRRFQHLSWKRGKLFCAFFKKKKKVNLAQITWRRQVNKLTLAMKLKLTALHAYKQGPCQADEFSYRLLFGLGCPKHTAEQLFFTMQVISQKLK